MANKIGVVSNDYEVLTLEKMKVPKKNIFTVQNSNKAANALRAGDAFCVASISNVFSSVEGLRGTMEWLTSLGGEFISCDERRLNFSVAKPLQLSVRETVGRLAQAERDMEYMLNQCKMDFNQRSAVLSAMKKRQVALLAYVLNNETQYKFRN